MNGHVIWIEEVRRSARPRTLPPWVSMTSQPSRATDTAVTVAAPRMLKISGRGDLRRPVKAGQTAMVTSPSEVQARCCGVEPTTGSGDAAMPMLHKPATSSRIACGQPDPGQARGGHEVTPADQEQGAGHDPPVGSGVTRQYAHRLADRAVGGRLERAADQPAPGDQDRRQAGRDNRPPRNGPAGAGQPRCRDRQPARVPPDRGPVALDPGDVSSRAVCSEDAQEEERRREQHRALLPCRPAVPQLHPGCLLPSILRRLAFVRWRCRCGRWACSTAGPATTG
jgi:hypothetical protein